MKRKYSKGFNLVFKQVAKDGELWQAKQIAKCFNKVFKHTKVHIRRGKIVTCRLTCKTDMSNGIKFAYAVNKQIAENRKTTFTPDFTYKNVKGLGAISGAAISKEYATALYGYLYNTERIDL